MSKVDALVAARLKAARLREAEKAGREALHRDGPAPAAREGLPDREGIPEEVLLLREIEALKLELAKPVEPGEAAANERAALKTTLRDRALRLAMIADASGRPHLARRAVSDE